MTNLPKHLQDMINKYEAKHESFIEKLAAEYTKNRIQNPKSTIAENIWLSAVATPLVNAAPDLLAALENCLNQLATNDLQEVYKRTYLSAERRNMLTAAQVQAQNAISKAKGR